MRTISIGILCIGFICNLGCNKGFQSESTGQVSPATSVPVAPDNSVIVDSGEPSPNPPSTSPEGRNITNLNVFFMGHSLVGHDIPQLVEQFSESHSVPANYNYQLGWGTTMRAHWDFYVNGTEFPGLFQGDSNFRPAHEALNSQEYNVLIMTEMVEIIHAVRYFDSYQNAINWAGFAESASPSTQVYMYETWPNLDVQGELSGAEDHIEYTTGSYNDYWLNKIDFDHDQYWRQQIFDPMNETTTNNRVLMIPAGQVMKEFVVLLESTPGGVGGVTQRQQLFSDNIHLSDYGTYLVALAQISTVLDRSPCGLPANWTKNNEMPNTPTAELATAMKNTVKRVLANHRDITEVSFSSAPCSNSL